MFSAQCLGPRSVASWTILPVTGQRSHVVGVVGSLNFQLACEYTLVLKPSLKLFDRICIARKRHAGWAVDTGYDCLSRRYLLKISLSLTGPQTDCQHPAAELRCINVLLSNSSSDIRNCQRL